MIDQINESIKIDVCGQICPSSLLTALREVNNYKDPLRRGMVKLEILTDNHDSTNRICDAVVNMGYRVEVDDQKNQYKICIAKMAGKKSL